MSCPPFPRTSILALLAVARLCAQASAPSVAAVQSAASYVGWGVAPGEIVLLSGSQMGLDSLTGAQLDASGNLSTQLAGTRVRFDDVYAPLVYASAKYVSAIVPYSTYGHNTSLVRVEYMGVSSTPLAVPIASSSPGLFTANASGTGQAAAVNEDGTFNSPSNPAVVGSIISLYGTGEGQTLPSGADGQISANPRPAPLLPVTVQIGAVTASVLYNGNAGYLQINARIPTQVTPGNAVPVTITVGNVISRTNVTLAITGGSGVPGEWFVSASGSASGKGTQDDPLDLATAMAGAAGRIHPGDTIWLRAGTYRAPDSGGFNSTVAGTISAPIVVRNYHNERATLDGRGTEFVLAVNGGYVWFWGLELMDSNPSRSTNQTGGVHPNAYGVGVYGPGVRFINSVVHDTAQGFSAYDASSDAVFYGNLSYYNGFTAPDRNHGHGMYMQNITGTKLLLDNIVGDNADEGLQIYGSNAASVAGFRIAGNAAYNSSSWPSPNYQYNFLIAGGGTRKDIIFDQNYSFFDPAADYGFVTFGQYTSGQDIAVTNSVFVGGYAGPVVSMEAGPVVFTGNKCYVRTSALDQARLELGPNQNTTGWTWDYDQYYGKNLFFNGSNDGSTTQGVNLDFNGWKGATGLDQHSVFSDGAPTGKWIYVRPNQYEAKRGNIIVYNWDLSDTVSVDLSGVLASGDRYVIRDAQNFYGPSVASGTYSGGAISIPMKNLSKATPVGFKAPAHTAPLFGTFVVMSAS